MAITVNDNGTAGDGFAANFTSTDASGTEIIKAAVTGESHNINLVHLVCGAALTITLKVRSDALATPTTILGPIPLAANVPFTWFDLEPIRCGEAKQLVITASGSGTVWGYVRGVTQ